MSNGAAVGGRVMEAEIREQPEVYGRILAARAAIREVAEAVRTRDVRFVVFVARGSSDNAAIYGKYLVETRLGLPAGLGSPSATTVYGASPTMEGVLLVAVSQSGESPDIAAATAAARGGGAVTVCLTEEVGSPLAREAEFTVDLHAGSERAVAATKTYTAELLTLFLLLEAIGGRDGSEAEPLPDIARRALDIEGSVDEVAGRLRDAQAALVVARGYDYATAREGALKLIEAARLPSGAFSAADLMHGPVAMIEHGFPVIAIMPSGRGGEAMTPVVHDLVRRGARLTVIGTGESTPDRLPIPPLEHDYLSPLITILPLQLLALKLGRSRGHDPDHPAGLRKVTRTA